MFGSLGFFSTTNSKVLSASYKFKEQMPMHCFGSNAPISLDLRDEQSLKSRKASPDCTSTISHSCSPVPTGVLYPHIGDLLQRFAMYCANSSMITSLSSLISATVTFDDSCRLPVILTRCLPLCK